LATPRSRRAEENRRGSGGRPRQSRSIRNGLPRRVCRASEHCCVIQLDRTERFVLIELIAGRDFYRQGPVVIPLLFDEVVD
jgi:hypothetical protein